MPTKRLGLGCIKQRQQNPLGFRFLDSQGKFDFPAFGCLIEKIRTRQTTRLRCVRLFTQASDGFVERQLEMPVATIRMTGLSLDMNVGSRTPVGE